MDVLGGAVEARRGNADGTVLGDSNDRRGISRLDGSSIIQRRAYDCLHRQSAAGFPLCGPNGVQRHGIGFIDRSPPDCKADAVPKSLPRSGFSKIASFPCNVANPEGPLRLEEFRFTEQAGLRLSDKIEVVFVPVLSGGSAAAPARSERYDPSLRSPAGRGAVTRAGTGGGRYSKGSADKPCEEGSSAANPAVHENVLHAEQVFTVVPDPAGAVRHVRSHDVGVSPSSVIRGGGRDVVGSKSTEHLASPGEFFVRFRGTDDEAQLPGS
mmetsp:Transcript_63962/g.71483  ORF Transcript_63962/g.71483 Transcript_63962/m.71483 type:complete len:268 (+) Transcript_63962:397-1200(+)